MNTTAGKRERLATADEIAEMLSVPVSWVYQRTANNTIPHIKVGRYVRFKSEEVFAWLELNN